MKKYHKFIFYATVLLTAIIGFGFLNNPDHKKLVADTAPGFAVVELFTSEGCSSCPSADVLAGIIEAEKTGNVYVLSFHVDYWDQLGWKDIFSNNAYTARQAQYARMFKLKSIYTPEMVVNGKTEFVGSDETKLRANIKRELASAASLVIELGATITDAKTVTVTCGVKGGYNNILNIALVQKHAETAIKRGENQGKLMKHTNIVRDLKNLNISPNASTVKLAIPDGLLAKDIKVVAFVQNRSDLKVTAAAEKDL